MLHYKIIDEEAQNERLRQFKREKSEHYKKSKNDNEYSLTRHFQGAHIRNSFYNDTEIHKFVFFLEQEFVLIEIDNFSKPSLKYQNNIDDAQEIVEAFYKRNSTKSVLLEETHRDFIWDKDLKNKKARLEIFEKTFHEVNHIYKYQNQEKALVTEVTLDHFSDTNISTKALKAIEYLKSIGYDHLTDTVRILEDKNTKVSVSKEKIVKSIDEFITNFKLTL